MKRILSKLGIPAIMLGSALLTFTSCDKVIQPSGNVTAEEHAFTGYSAIDVSDAFDAFISFDPDGESVRIEADDNLHEFIDVKQINDRLYIGVERNYNFNEPATLRAYIGTSGTITGIYASGASHITLTDTLSAERCRVEASGASRIVGPVELEELGIHGSGASSIDLAGSAADADIALSGASSQFGFDLVAGNLDISLSGASSASLTVENTLAINASGASILRYKGDAMVIESNLEGGSQAVHVD